MIGVSLRYDSFHGHYNLIACWDLLFSELNNEIIKLTYRIQKTLRKLSPVDISEIKLCKINCDYLVGHGPIGSA